MSAAPASLPREQRAMRETTVQRLMQSLSHLMQQFRRARLNPALAFQLFSRLFHTTSAWIFNGLTNRPEAIQAPRLGQSGNEVLSTRWPASLRLDPDVWLTRNGGRVLLRRLDRIQHWASRQGLELAAECHMQRCVQVPAFLIGCRSIWYLKTLAIVGLFGRIRDNLLSLLPSQTALQRQTARLAVAFFHNPIKASHYTKLQSPKPNRQLSLCDNFTFSYFFLFFPSSHGQLTLLSLSFCQACHLIMADRSSLDDLYQTCLSLTALNSVQLEFLLSNLADSPNVPDEWIDVIIAGAKEIGCI
ncbi:unnamed protein product [Protopolystoma xenopodis]|uniref:Uncharacterized protein n=1 Tax=Protopolystoma xenopodis TaxID=117903 RepID=A0A448WGB3_9PLAT|nr:unnamed protein product [Protopolystoma xenopodis]